MRSLLWHDLARPLTSISYALDYAVWGGRALGYRLTGVLLHTLNVVLLYLLVRQITFDRPVTSISARRRRRSGWRRWSRRRCLQYTR